MLLIALEVRGLLTTILPSWLTDFLSFVDGSPGIQYLEMLPELILTAAALASVTCQQLSAKRQLHQRSTRSLASTTSHKYEPRLRPVRLERRITHRVSRARHAGFRSLGALSWLIFQAP